MRRRNDKTPAQTGAPGKGKASVRTGALVKGKAPVILALAACVLLAGALCLHGCGRAGGDTAGTEGQTEAVPGAFSVLFIGNSLTRWQQNRFVDYFQALCEAGGRQAEVEECTFEGCTFKKYADASGEEGGKAYALIREKNWDYVVLQENTDWITAKYDKTEKYAKILVGWIKENNPQTQIVYNATWAYKEGAEIDGTFYSFEENQSAINENYEKLAEATGGIAAYTGEAFLAYRSQYDAPELYRPDNNHPTKDGAYLSACAMYAALLGTPEGLEYYGDTEEAAAVQMQSIAAAVSE